MNEINMNVEQVLQRMRVLSQQTMPETTQAPQADFSQLLADSIKQVNQLQQDAGDLKTAYEMGERGVDLPEVMVAVQKASVAFEGATQIRNKLLSAYQEVMNMQV